jgi:hypothetical protein
MTRSYWNFASSNGGVSVFLRLKNKVTSLSQNNVAGRQGTARPHLGARVDIEGPHAIPAAYPLVSLSDLIYATAVFIRSDFMATRDGMLEWADEPDGSRKCNIGVGGRIGWITIKELHKDNFQIEAWFALGSVGGGPEGRQSAEEIAQSWIDTIGGEPLPNDGSARIEGRVHK